MDESKKKEEKKKKKKKKKTTTVDSVLVISLSLSPFCLSIILSLSVDSVLSFVLL